MQKISTRVICVMVSTAGLPWYGVSEEHDNFLRTFSQFENWRIDAFLLMSTNGKSASSVLILKTDKKILLYCLKKHVYIEKAF